MAISLEDVIQQLVLDAKEAGSTIYTAEAVKRIRADHPDLESSSASLTNAIIRAASENGVPLRMEVPLEVL